MQKVKLENLKRPIHYNEVIDVNGQAGQDLFVIAMLEGKPNGRWLEFGCGGPFHENNTLTLEKQFGWSGISIDNAGSNILYSGLTLEQEWQQWRPGAKFFNIDADSYDFTSNLPRVDYLQIDLDDPDLAFNILKKFTQHSKFSVMTFEHDYWVHTSRRIQLRNHRGPIIRQMTREYLKNLGYVLLAADVVIDPKSSGHVNDPPGMPPIYFEDWWVDPTIISKEIIATYCSTDSLIPDKYWTKILLK